jgi:hypothetical protein
MLTELNIVGNKVLKYKLSTNLVDNLCAESIAEWQKNIDGSVGYPEASPVYLFRTPTSLTNPPTGPGYQWSIQDTESITQFKNIALETISNQFGYEYRIQDIWYLLQTNDSWINNPVHQHLTSEWIAVAYVKVHGDGIEFSDDGGNTEVYYPEVGDVLMFPATAKHRPLPNTGPEYRISLNVELNTQKDIQETQEQKTRMEVCNTCEELTSLKMCSQCKCFMPFKTKISSAVCPLNKW